MDAFRDHGSLRESLVEDVAGAKKILADAEAAGLDLADVTKALVVDGVKAVLPMRRIICWGRWRSSGPRCSARLWRPCRRSCRRRLQKAVDAAAKDWASQGKLRDMWGRRGVGVDRGRRGQVAGLAAGRRCGDGGVAEAEGVPGEGEGGGVLGRAAARDGAGRAWGPEVLAQTFGQQAGFPALHILDSTDPAQIKALHAKVDLSKTLCIVSSKSGSTLEPNIFKAYFFDEMKKAVGEKAGAHFVAVDRSGLEDAGGGRGRQVRRRVLRR